MNLTNETHHKIWNIAAKMRYRAEMHPLWHSFEGEAFHPLSALLGLGLLTNIRMKRMRTENRIGNRIDMYLYGASRISIPPDPISLRAKLQRRTEAGASVEDKIQDKIRQKVQSYRVHPQNNAVC